MTRRARPVVAIDGPAGSGKSTASRLLADRLGFVLVDTGALYRAVALVAQEDGVPWDDGPATGRLAAALDVRFVPRPGKKPAVLVGGRDRTDEVRSPAVSEGASRVSAHPEVRDALLGRQRALGAGGGVVLEGRDIGTVVFPDAEVKVFLTASPEARARRRTDELRAAGRPVDYEATLAEIRARDRRDETRAVAPLRPAPDAVRLDTTDLPLDDVVEQLRRLVRERTGAG